jgi:hypothetical protein
VTGSQNLVLNYPDFWHMHHDATRWEGARNPEYDKVKYQEDQHLMIAAQEVHLIDTGSAGDHPTLSRIFEYPDFGVFELHSEND